MTATSKSTTFLTKVRDTKSAEMTATVIPVSLTSTTTARKSTSTIMMAARTSATITSTIATKETVIVTPRTWKTKVYEKKSAFIIGDNMIKKIDGYLLSSFVNYKYIVVARLFISAKTVDIFEYIKPMQKDFNPDVYILHVGANKLLFNKSQEQISLDILN